MSLSHINKHPQACVAIASGLVGALFFIAIYGVHVLDVTYVDWIRNAGGDLAQSYYGWQFYRASDWYFPFGLMDSVAYPSLTSIIYIDSVPLFNFIFKCLSPVLPQTFQFFGIWGLTCFVLNTALGSLCVYRLTKDEPFSILSAPIFAPCTFVLQRLYVHTALAANWVILLTIFVILGAGGGISARSWKVKAFKWFGIFACAVSVNIYYLPIIGTMMLCYCIWECLRNKSLIPVLGIFASSLVGVAFAFWFFGGFYHFSSSLGATTTSLGYYSANLNALLNPMQTDKYLSGFVSILATHGLATKGQYEGYAYLGAGALVGMLLAFVSVLVCWNRFKSWAKRNKSAFVLTVTACIVFASGFYVYLCISKFESSI